MAHPSGTARLATGLVLVVAATLATFWPALGNEFVAWDDDVNFLLNPHYRGLSAENLEWMFTSFHVGHYMPLTWLSAAVDYELWELDPFGYHLTNLVLHATVAVLFALVVLRLLPGDDDSDGGKRVAAAVLGALFFALHPLRVESVAWATERRDVLSGVFLMLTVLAWLRSLEGPRRGAWYMVSLLAFAASLLSKVSGLALPAALLVLDAFPLGRLRGRADLRRLVVEKLPYAALGLGGALSGYLGQQRSTELLASLEAAPLVQRAAVALFGLAFYVRKTLFPTGLAPLYEMPQELDPLAAPYLLAAALVGATTAVLLLRRKSSWGAAGLAAWIAYVALAAPVLGLVQVGRHLAADRYSYVTCLPFAVLFAAAVQRTARSGWIAAIGIVLLLGVGANRQTRHWRDSEALFRRVVAVEPDSYLGHRKLGIALHEAGRYDEALEQYQRCLEIRPERDNADAWTSLALSTMERGEPGDVERTFAALQAALRDDGRHRLAWDVYENLSLRAGRADELESVAAAVLAADPRAARPFVARARIRAAQGDHEGAVAMCARALASDPEEVGALNLAGVELVYLGRWEEAEDRLRRARRLRPADANVLANLGLVLSRTGRLPEAEALWRAALAVDPSHAAARQLLETSGASSAPQ